MFQSLAKIKVFTLVTIILLICSGCASKNATNTEEDLFCGDAEFQCPWTDEQFSVATSYKVYPTPGCEFDDNITSEMYKKCPQPCCKNWPSRVNGCSVPVLKGLTKVVKEFLEYHFVDPCNMHDLCYSSPKASKSNCDNELRDNMLAICNSEFGDPIQKGICSGYAEIVYEAVHKEAGFAFNDDQDYVAQNCLIKTDQSGLKGSVEYGMPIYLHSMVIGTSGYVRMMNDQRAEVIKSTGDPTTFYIRPFKLGSNSGCVKYGDPVLISATSASGDTSNCGKYGCRVSTMDDDHFLYFDHGDAVKTPLYFRPLRWSGKDGQCIRFQDRANLNATNTSGNTSNCGWLGCRVLKSTVGDTPELFFDHGVAAYPTAYITFYPEDPNWCPY